MNHTFLALAPDAPARAAGSAPRALAPCLGLLLLAAAAQPAGATCNPVAFSPATVDVGTKGYAPLPPADVAGYKLAGTAAVVLRAVCDDVPDARQITIDSLVAADTPGLVRWSSTTPGAGTAGAARLTVQQATVGGYAVPMTFTPVGGTTSAATQGPLVLPSAGVLALDLRGVPATGDARKTLVMNVQIHTLLKSAGFAPTTATPFRLDLGASLP